MLLGTVICALLAAMIYLMGTENRLLFSAISAPNSSNSGEMIEICVQILKIDCALWSRIS